MEYGWERTFPFLDIDINKVSKLFEGVLKKEDIVNIIPINEGCRTTNYIIQTREVNNKYLLKIFFSAEQNHKKEVKLLDKLANDICVPVPRIYKFNKHEIIEDKEYAIYQYIDGKTIGQAIYDGCALEENLIREVARSLAKIHSYKFDKAGYLDENLNIVKELPPLNLWYQDIIRDRTKNRLGKSITDKINHIVKENEKVLIKIDEDIRLVHGDFQGTNILTTDGRLAGILDWEFAMAGHPLSDIGQFFRYEEYFDKNLIKAFEDEYNKSSSYKLISDWYKISKLRDLISLIQLINTKEYMPNKHENIKIIINDTLEQF